MVATRKQEEKWYDLFSDSIQKILGYNEILPFKVKNPELSLKVMKTMKLEQYLGLRLFLMSVFSLSCLVFKHVHMKYPCDCVVWHSESS